MRITVHGITIEDDVELPGESRNIRAVARIVHPAGARGPLCDVVALGAGADGKANRNSSPLMWKLDHEQWIKLRDKIDDMWLAYANETKKRSGDGNGQDAG